MGKIYKLIIWVVLSSLRRIARMRKAARKIIERKKAEESNSANPYSSTIIYTRTYNTKSFKYNNYLFITPLLIIFKPS